MRRAHDGICTHSTRYNQSYNSQQKCYQSYNEASAMTDRQNRTHLAEWQTYHSCANIRLSKHIERRTAAKQGSTGVRQRVGVLRRDGHGLDILAIWPPPLNHLFVNSSHVSLAHKHTWLFEKHKQTISYHLHGISTPKGIKHLNQLVKNE